MSCGESNSSPKELSPQEGIEAVIKEYCNATTKRKPKEIADLIYPGIYKIQERVEIEKFYYSQLNNTKTFRLENVTFSEACTLIDKSKNHKVYLQKYKMKTTIGLDSISAVSGFQMIKNIAKKSDDKASINEDLYEVSYQDKKRIMIVEDGKNNYFIFPEIFLTAESASEFNLESVKKELGLTP